MKNLELSEARELSTFLFPDEPLSTSGAVGRRTVLNLLSAKNVTDEGKSNDAPAAERSTSAEDKERDSNSLFDFRGIEVDVALAVRTKKADNKKKNNDGGRNKKRQVDHEDDSSGESSDDDEYSDADSDDGGFAKYCRLSPKFRQIIRHQDGALFAAFFKPQALQISTKSDLYKVLSHFWGGLYCARALCRLNNLSISHQATVESFHSKQIPIVLPDLRAHPQLSFPMKQRVAPGAIHQFLQSRSIVA